MPKCIFSQNLCCLAWKQRIPLGIFPIPNTSNRCSEGHPWQLFHTPVTNISLFPILIRNFFSQFCCSCGCIRIRSYSSLDFRQQQKKKQIRLQQIFRLPTVKGSLFSCVFHVPCKPLSSGCGERQAAVISHSMQALTWHGKRFQCHGVSYKLPLSSLLGEGRYRSLPSRELHRQKQKENFFCRTGVHFLFFLPVIG